MNSQQSPLHYLLALAADSKEARRVANIAKADEQHISPQQRREALRQSLPYLPLPRSLVHLRDMPKAQWGKLPITYIDTVAKLCLIAFNFESDGYELPSMDDITAARARRRAAP